MSELTPIISLGSLANPSDGCSPTTHEPPNSHEVVTIKRALQQYLNYYPLRELQSL
jgi:hypothetical protein